MSTHSVLNQTTDKLDTADKLERNIRTKYQIQSCTEFLDVLVRNCHGQLTASVSHAPTAEPYNSVLDQKLCREILSKTAS